MGRVEGVQRERITSRPSAQPGSDGVMKFRGVAAITACNAEVAAKSFPIAVSTFRAIHREAVRQEETNKCEPLLEGNLPKTWHPGTS